jgi:hypothetical protein
LGRCRICFNAGAFCGIIAAWLAQRLCGGDGSGAAGGIEWGKAQARELTAEERSEGAPEQDHR